MNFSSFLKGLVITTAVSMLAYLLFQFFAGTGEYLDMAIYSILLFALVCVGIYFYTRFALASENKNLFFFVVVYNIFFKVFLSFILLYIYVKTFDPQSKIFIVPFLIVYFIFTIFETYFLSIQSKESK